MKPIPKQKRIKVYKQALDILIKNKPLPSELQTPYLCLLLPCLAFKLECYLNILPNGEDWYPYHAQIMFPELKTFLKRGTYGEYTNEERIAFLKEVSGGGGL